MPDQLEATGSDAVGRHSSHSSQPRDIGVNENGQGIPIDPQAVINQLMQRINNLTMELAVKDAYIAQLQAVQTNLTKEEISG